MQDGRQLTTTSNTSVAIQTRESLKHCPVAQLLYDQTGGKDGIPLGAVEVVAATADRSITTAADSVRSAGQVSVRCFAKDFGQRSLSALILAHLGIVEDMLNTARPMKPEAIAQLAKNVAQLLTNDDVTISLADLQIVADRLANGEAGQVYGGLNAPTVMRAFADYIAEKANAFAEWHEEQDKEQYGSFGQRTGASQAEERMKNRAALAEYLRFKV